MKFECFLKSKAQNEPKSGKSFLPFTAFQLLGFKFLLFGVCFGQSVIPDRVHTF